MNRKAAAMALIVTMSVSTASLGGVSKMEFSEFLDDDDRFVSSMLRGCEPYPRFEACVTKQMKAFRTLSSLIRTKPDTRYRLARSCIDDIDAVNWMKTLRCLRKKEAERRN